MAVSKARSTRHMRNCLILYESMEGLEFYVFDVETTGIDKNSNYIIELSAIKCRIHNKMAEEIDSIDIFMKPPFLMDNKVISIHGITNEFLADKESEEDAINKIMDFFGEKPILVGHNVSFDIGMIEEMYKRCGAVFNYEIDLDTLDMARDIISSSETDGYKLSTITKYYGLDYDITFHRAIDDVRATLRILNVFHAEYAKKFNNIKLLRKEKVYVNYMYFWKGFNKNQQGLYLVTNLGKIYLSTTQKCWCSSEVNLDMVDIDSLESTVVKRTGVSFTELAKMTEKKWETLMSNGVK